MGHEMKGKNIYDVFKSSLDFAPATTLHRNHLSTLEGAIKGFRVFKATLFVLRRVVLEIYVPNIHSRLKVSSYVLRSYVLKCSLKLLYSVFG